MKSSSRSSKRKTKRSQKHSKKRTKSSREKPKKLKQRDDSVSLSDEDSITTKSVSCLSPGDDSRSKKRGRSRDKRRKKDKKRSKKSSVLSESSGDDSPCVKKPKKSKRKRGSDSRKKRHVKRRKRDRSVSSSSSRSRSCSVGEPNGDSEREFGKKEEKVESKERKGREKDRKKSGSKRSRHRSRSCSPCSVHSESSSHYSEERVPEKSNPKRLKSVIVVLKDQEEVPKEHELNKDDRHEDEIVFEYDDYPSKSNDSIDGVSGREAVSYIHDVSSEKRFLDDPYKVSVASDVRTSDIPGIQRQVVDGSGELSPSYVRSRDNVPSMENRIADLTANAGSNHVGLEAILRQKALENLLKRQGKLSTKTTSDKKDDHDIEVKRSSIVKTQTIDQPTPHDKGNIKFVPKVEKTVNDVRYNSRTINLRGSSENTGLSKDSNAHVLSAKVETSRPEDKGKAHGDFNSRSNVGLSMSRKDFLGAKNTWKRQLNAQESSLKTLSAPKESIVRDSNDKLTSLENSQSELSVTQKTISKDFTRDFVSTQSDIKDSTIKVDTVAVSEAEASASALASVSNEQCMDDSTNKADEDAQFQQKTMSVMRGGEMVQVSYKVYIPKKAPALARRQLKR